MPMLGIVSSPSRSRPMLRSQNSYGGSHRTSVLAAAAGRGGSSMRGEYPAPPAPGKEMTLHIGQNSRVWRRTFAWQGAVLPDERNEALHFAAILLVDRAELAVQAALVLNRAHRERDPT